MKYFLFYHLFEKTLQESEEELKAFQSDSNIMIGLDELLQSIEAMRVSLRDIFPSLLKVKDLDKLHDTTEFTAQVRLKKMRLGEVLDSSDHYTFMDTPIKCVMVYRTEYSELDTPTYMILQRKDGKKWLVPELYYVQEDISNFFRKLTSLSLTITNDEEVWEYATSNSGEDWILQQGRETEVMKQNIDWKDINTIKKNKSYRLIFE